jgi:hypothetical protein
LILVGFVVVMVLSGNAALIIIWSCKDAITRKAVNSAISIIIQAIEKPSFRCPDCFILDCCRELLFKIKSAKMGCLFKGIDLLTYVIMLYEKDLYFYDSMFGSSQPQ